MRFTKPAWLCHTSERKDFEIYSLSVSPDGARLATAAGDGHVRIWSTAAILHAGDPASGNAKARQLASLAHHSGTVHSVRFSPNAKYLASGADDKIVCVYSLEPGEPSYATFGSKEQPPVENWRIFRRLIGHDNDVQDLGWSADSSILVSVGLDSKVVVWSGSTFEKLKTLANHQSHVKGVTFDPANKYFATASDDRTIKIYRFTSPAPNATAYDQTSNFTLEATVSAPFATSPLTTYFRRCSWSPEGAHIAAANATNGPVSSVAIIERGNWQSEINLIGHEGPVEVCAFSPRMFFNHPPPTPEQLQQGQQMPPAVSVIACAGQDKTISVWNTSFPRPFVTTAELSAKPISDLAWSPDGETLFAASLDGTIAALVFEKGELGYPSTVGDNEQRLAKYGAGRRAGIIEGADALRLEEGSKAGELKGVEGRMGELMGDAGQHATGGALTNGDAAPQTNGTAAPASTAPVTINGTTNGTTAEPAPAVPIPPRDPQQDKLDKIKSRVTFTKDGKKRIAPLLVSSSNVGEANLPKPQLQASVRSGAGSDDPAGKTLDLSKPYDGLPKGGLASLLFGNKRKYAEVDGDNDEERKRAEKRVQAVQASGATPIVNNTPDGLVPASSATSKKTPAEIPEVLRPAIINPSLSVAQTRLAVPQVRTLILRPLDITKSADNLQTSNTTTDPSTSNTTTTDNDSTVVLEARNASGPSRTGRAQDREPARLSLTKRNQILWQDFLPRAILLTTGNRNFWAAACEDGSLHLWTPAGRRMVAPIILEAQAVILDCRAWWLMAITAVGMVYVWDIRKMEKKQGLPVSLAPVLDAAGTVMGMAGQLTASPALMFARLNTNGVVICGMSNGEGYAYNPSMGTWQRLSEGWWAVGSQYWNTLDNNSTTTTTTTSSSSSSAAVSAKTNGIDLLSGVAPENISAGILPLLERHTTTHALLKGRAYFLQRLLRSLISAEGYEGLETTVSISHLEHRLAATQMLGARDEFKVALLMYAKRIGSEGMRGRVEELLRGLMGSNMFEDDDEGDDRREGQGGVWGEDEEIVGWKREELLREVVVVLGRQRDLQRVTVPYARLLGILDWVPEKEGGNGEEMVMVMEGG